MSDNGKAYSMGISALRCFGTPPVDSNMALAYRKTINLTHDGLQRYKTVRREFLPGGFVWGTEKKTCMRQVFFCAYFALRHS